MGGSVLVSGKDRRETAGLFWFRPSRPHDAPSLAGIFFEHMLERSATFFLEQLGELIKEDWLADYGLTQYPLAKALKIPQSRLTDIIKGRRGITTDTGRASRSLLWQLRRVLARLAGALRSGDARRRKDRGRSGAAGGGLNVKPRPFCGWGAGKEISGSNP